MEEGGWGGEADGGGGGVVIRRRITLLDQMSAVHDRRDSLAGLTLDAILSNKRPLPPSSPPPAPAGRTLLDIIRDEDPNDKTFGHKDRKSWKLFRDKLRLKRAGAAWTSSVNVPASDIPIRSGGFNISNPRSQLSRRSSVRFQTNPAGEVANQLEDSVSTTNRGLTPQFTRRCSSRISSFPTESNHQEDSPDGDGSPSSRSSRPIFSRYNSSRVAASNPEPDENSADPFEVAREGTHRLAVALAQERALSAREAVAAQEAAEAEAAAVAAAEAAEAEASMQEEEEEAAAEGEPAQPPAPRMSLMDLLEETDRQMGVEGSRYTVGEEEEGDEEEYEEEEEEEGDEAEGNGGGGGGIEYNCCVCMVRHKGAAFIPCGHTFCRLCSRELWVQRGNCPLCNGFILEILDIF